MVPDNMDKKNISSDYPPTVGRKYGCKIEQIKKMVLSFNYYSKKIDSLNRKHARIFIKSNTANITRNPTGQ
jgi:hypothetical protein